MNICYIASDVVIPHHRGASTHTLELARHLTLRGHTVHLISRKGLGQASTEIVDGVSVHRIQDGIVFSNPYSSYRRKSTENVNAKSSVLKQGYNTYFTRIFPTYVAIRASEIIRSTKSQIVLERETSFGAGGMASYLTHRPLVLEIIGPRYSKFSVDRAGLILYYNPQMITFSNSNSKKLVKVSAAANTDLFKYDIRLRGQGRASLGLDGKTVIGFLGTFAAWQGVDDIVSAALELRQNTSYHFLMIGPYYERISEKVHELGLSDIFTFLGAIDYVDVPMYLCASDIVLAPYNIPSSSDRSRSGIGSSLKVFEYMACSRPVISSDIFPINQEITNGVNSILVPPGDIRALATAIEELASNTQEQNRLGEAGRRLVENEYSWNAVAKTIETKMHDLLAGNHAG